MFLPLNACFCIHIYSGSIAVNLLYDLCIRGQRTKWHDELVQIMIKYIRDFNSWHADMEPLISDFFYNFWHCNGRFGIGGFDPAIYQPYRGQEAPLSLTVRYGVWDEWSKNKSLSLTPFDVKIARCISYHSIVQGMNNRQENSISMFNQTTSDMTNHKNARTRTRQWYLKWNWREIQRYNNNANV